MEMLLEYDREKLFYLVLPALNSIDFIGIRKFVGSCRIKNLETVFYKVIEKNTVES